MQFAKAVDGEIISGTFEQLWPNVEANDRSVYAQMHGFVPVASILPFNPVLEKLNSVPVYYNAGLFYDVEVGNQNLFTIKLNLHAIVAEERYVAEQAGVVYEFPDGTGTVQTRNDTDIRNVQAQVLAAVILSGQGITDPIMSFRDAENETHVMTPVQMITMGMTVSATISGLYQTKWTKDEQIEALASVTEARDWAEANIG